MKSIMIRKLHRVRFLPKNMDFLKAEFIVIFEYNFKEGTYVQEFSGNFKHLSLNTKINDLIDFF